MSQPPDPFLEDLFAYRPDRHEPADLDAFWATTLAAARQAAAAPSFTGIDTPLRTLVAEDVAFSGFEGQRIRGWLLRPAHATARLPVVVEYLGYGRGRSVATMRLFWASAGYASFVMDSRGQNGDTPDSGAGADRAGHHPGFVTQGIDEPATYYYRRLITDAVLATDAVRQHPAVDPERVIVTGHSQGGGIALAVAGLATDVQAAMIDAPFLCDIRHAIRLTDVVPGYGEIVEYLSLRRDRADQVLGTLDYVDGLGFAARATAPALFSTGLRDTACPPSTVFAAYNHYAGAKEMIAWPFNGHEAGDVHQDLAKAAFLERLGLAPGRDVIR